MNATSRLIGREQIPDDEKESLRKMAMKETEKRTGEMVYLACPYSHESYTIRLQRFTAANIVAAKLFNEGVYVFSPISHTHPIASAGNLPQGWEFWREYDTRMLAVCERLIVLTIGGWEKSVGVQAEIEIANRLGIKIEYMQFEQD